MNSTTILSTKIYIIFLKNMIDIFYDRQRITQTIYEQIHTTSVSSSNPFTELYIYSPDTNVFLLSYICCHIYVNAMNLLVCNTLVLSWFPTSHWTKLNVVMGKSKSKWWKLFISASNGVVSALSALGGNTAFTMSVLEGSKFKS